MTAYASKSSRWASFCAELGWLINPRSALGLKPVIPTTQVILQLSGVPGELINGGAAQLPAASAASVAARPW